MAVNAYKQINTQSFELSQVQSNVAFVLDPLVRLPTLDGTLLTGVSLSTAVTQVNHLLGRQPLGWQLADINSNATVWRTGWNNKTLSLQASADTTVNLWVF